LEKNVLPCPRGGWEGRERIDPLPPATQAELARRCGQAISPLVRGRVLKTVDKV